MRARATCWSGVAGGLAFVTALGAWGCGSAPPPEAKEPEPEQHEVKPQLRTKSELGTVDPGAVQAVFHKLADRFMDCQKRGLERVEVLSGNVKFFLRIGEDGSAKWAYLESGSDVGDQGTEKCLVGVVMGARWPKPDGGDAEARYSIELPPDGRPASDWSSDKVAGALGKHGDEIDKCKAGSSGKFEATMYVGPGGKVLTAGVVTSSKDANDQTECLVNVLEKLKGLPSPGSWPAKVTFGL